MKIALVSDSGCGLTPQVAKERGIYLLPLQIINGQESLRDCFDIETLALYELLKEGAMPKTSMPLVSDVEVMFDLLIKEGYDEVICIPLSSGLSGTHQMISMVAKEKEMPLTLVEIYSTCMIQQHIVLKAKELIDQGFGREEIKAQLDQKIESNITLILPNDLDHLKRGGRLTPLAASLANLLKIKPILQIGKHTEGKIDVFAKVRTEKKAMNVAIDYLCDKAEKNKHYQFYVIHSNNLAKAEMISSILQTRNMNFRVTIDIISAVIASHTGLDCIAIQMIETE